jgi:hypothetical protein
VATEKGINKSDIKNRTSRNEKAESRIKRKKSQEDDEKNGRRVKNKYIGRKEEIGMQETEEENKSNSITTS